ncbi:MAG: SH3 domain-containing protein [Clostridia bacterium]|nr:SH3 domain-containing protein [Clostridia bacterium]
MKRVLALLALLCLLAPCALCEWAAVRNDKAGDRLHLRAKPSADAISYGKYYSGVQVQVLERDAGNGFSRVRIGAGNGIGDLEGYMKTVYLAFGRDAETVRDERPFVTLRSPGGGSVSLRNWQDSSSLGTLKSGTGVTVLGVGTRYLHVISGNEAGFVPVDTATPRLSFSGSSTYGTRQAASYSAPAYGQYPAGVDGTDRLPYCYRLLLPGQAWCIAQGTAGVYADRTLGGAPVASLGYAQEVEVEEIDEARGRAFVSFTAGGRQTRGWTESRMLFSWGDPTRCCVVVTDAAGGRLNLRSRAVKGSESLGKYYAGTIALRTGREENGFVSVRIGHMEGWMDRRYLRSGLYAEGQEPPVTMVRAERAAVRKQPWRRSEQIQTAHQGDSVTVLGVRADGWVQVMFQNEIGFIEKDALAVHYTF